MHQQPREYRCPGERYAISRSVHLGRLAGFYPACRACAHRDDTGTLSARQVEQLHALSPRKLPSALYYDEGAAGAYLNEVGPKVASELAAAFGGRLYRQMVAADDEAETPDPPRVVVVGDGRPLAAEIVAAVVEGLRFSGCMVTDCGQGTSASLVHAMSSLRAGGGVSVGNPGHAAQTVGLKFWAVGGAPVSRGAGLEEIEAVARSGFDRPTRTAGKLLRPPADFRYLDTLRPLYHGLRPLTIVLDSSSAALHGFVERLLAPTACSLRLSRAQREGMPKAVLDAQGDLGLRVDGDGEGLELWDERGRLVPTWQWMRLLLAELPEGIQEPVIALQEGADEGLLSAIEASGGRAVVVDGTRAAMSGAMRLLKASFGVGAAGCCWHVAENGAAMPDALQTMSLLLAALSRDDRPLSAVLDCEGLPG